MQPFFSIVIPTFNRASTVGLAISSVQDQSLIDWEIIVVDDGSNDSTESKIQPFLADSRIQFFRQENMGVSTARNFGASKAAGKFLLFLDSDDELCTDFLNEAQSIILQDNAAQCFCFSAVFKIPDSGDVIIKPKYLGRLYSNKSGLFLAGTFVVARAKFWEAGGYDPDLAFGENDELGQRLCRICDIKCSNDRSLIAHRVRKKENNERYKRATMASTLEHYLGKYKDELIKVDKNKLVVTNNRLAVCYFVLNKEKLAFELLAWNIRNSLNIDSLRIMILMKFTPSLYRKLLNWRGLI